jgi:hypothetical protein
MMKSFSRRALLLAPFGVLLVALIYAACTPGSSITASESDVVLTLFDDTFGFDGATTYVMPDSILHLTGDPDEPDSPLLSRANDQDILDLVASNFAARGYQRRPTTEAATVDFQVLVTAQAAEVWNLYSYYPWNPWYGGYPGWGWYYPPSVGASYAFTMGTLFVQMGEFERNDGTGDIEPKTAYWYAAINGVLDDTSQNKQRRLNDSINQAFEQSPYLRTN